MEETLLVNEIFGPTWQGEGGSVGKLCYFIRLFSCNQKCVFCDTPYTWLTKQLDVENHLYATEPFKVEDECHKMTFEEITRKILDLPQPIPFIELLVISGGEPMLQAKKINNYLNEYKYRRVEIETAGTIFNEHLANKGNVFFNVSPKLENSGNPLHVRYKKDVLIQFRMLGYRSVFKFVVANKKDFEEIDWIVGDAGISTKQVYIMMEGIDQQTQEDRLQKFIPQVLERGWNITPRLHISLFGNKRGT